ncbi:PQ-loop repeat family protein / transmembranefamily protein [Striga asiatica]|uniref:PQ-loop repeat family protein / transmembranefamily protein n=1 Tax=Striga asiatica TaxID=4170 RepID=A0A5A7PCY5_STRAF|nr:PQ-loop repeat family protein / transmembranefamily protein [Striga asiatica]
MNSVSYCVKEEKRCIGWAERYFGDCLCNLKDEFSFGFGLISLVCWGLAEIPQIITNFRAKSGHGISLAFLLTWIAGDIFNLVGCLLEPATLPTQLYTAVLYTATTVILVLQSIYYDYYKRLRHGQQKDSNYQEEDDIKKPLKPSKPNDSAIPIPNGTRRTEAYYYTSARSLAGSMTPPIRSYLWPIKSGPSALGLENDSSSDDEANPSPSPSPNTILATQTASRPKPISRSAGYGAFLATSMNLPRESNALVYIGLTGRKLLQEQGTETVYGQLLGWMMAAVYMGGRLPQIWLNIKRGSVEGLNPFMFVFALVANATYVASILVRSIAWDKIRANMPWLLDAVGCVILDLFVSFSNFCLLANSLRALIYLRKESRAMKEGRACNKR